MTAPPRAAVAEPPTWTVADTRPAPLADAGPGAAGGTLPAQGWTSRDLRWVILAGLVGGLLSALVGWGWVWLLNNPLLFLVPEEPAGVQALMYAGVYAVVMTTHGLFVGMLLRKPGVIVATLGVGLLTCVPFEVLSQLVMWERPVLEALFDVLRYTGVQLMIVGAVGELLRLLLRDRLDSLATAALIGLAVPLGWTLGLLVQTVVPGYSGSWASRFGAVDWLIWLVGITIGGFVFSGLIPALLSRRRSEVPGSAPVVPGTAGPAPAYVPASGRADLRSPAMPGAQEHPQANQVLVFGLIGMFVFAPLAIAAWVTGSKAKKEMALNPGYYRPSSSLQTGYVLGIIGTVVWLTGIVILIGVLVALLIASASM